MLRSLAEPIPPAVLPPLGGAAWRANTARLPTGWPPIGEVWLPWTDGDVSDEDYARLHAAAGLRPRSRHRFHNAGRSSRRPG